MLAVILVSDFCHLAEFLETSRIINYGSG